MTRRSFSTTALLSLIIFATAAADVLLASPTLLVLQTPHSKLVQGALAEFRIIHNNNNASDSTLHFWPFISDSHSKRASSSSSFVQFGANIPLRASPQAGITSSHNLTFLLPLARTGPLTVFAALLRTPQDNGGSSPTPFSGGTSPFTVGYSLDSVAPANILALSNNISLQVLENPDIARALAKRKQRSKSLASKGKTLKLVIYYELWFTPLNIGQWEYAEAIPLVGRYSSTNIGNVSSSNSSASALFSANRAVLLLHSIWLLLSGIDAISIDWTNNCWNQKTGAFAPPPNVQYILDATRNGLLYMALDPEVSAISPEYSLILGLDNGPICGPEALAGQVNMITELYLLSPVLGQRMMRDHRDGDTTGLPILLILDTGNLHASLMTPQLEDALQKYSATYRWMSTQFQYNHLNEQGFVSWMDGVVNPPATISTGGKKNNGTKIAMTITNAFFAGGGWLGEGAMATNNGATLALEAAHAIRTLLLPQQQQPQKQPPLVFLCQFNEFAGQPNGATGYTDSYNVSLSNDFEPVSRTACGLRRPGDAYCGGDGMRWVNLVSAMSSVVASAGNSNRSSSNLYLVFEDPVPWRSVSAAAAASATTRTTISVVTLGHCDALQAVEFAVKNGTSPSSSHDAPWFVLGRFPAAAARGSNKNRMQFQVDLHSANLVQGEYSTLRVRAASEECTSEVSIVDYNQLSSMSEGPFRSEDQVVFLYA